LKMLKLFKEVINKFRGGEESSLLNEEPEAAFEERFFELDQRPSKMKSIKTVAFHLPQFYEFEENNDWWGKGFTEWTNVTKAEPLFPGHFQPRLPHDDIGLYKLDNLASVENQANLALAAGIDAFCFYYYHLSGKKLLRKPVDLFTQLDSELEFCFCWANENWTRRWDAAEREVLARQLYDDDEVARIIEDVSGYMLKPNYLKVGERPFLILYEPARVPDLEKLVAKVREGIISRIGMNPYIGYIWRGEQKSYYGDLFDTAVSFPLHYPGQQAFHSQKVNGKKLHSYSKMMKKSIKLSGKRSDVLKCCIPSWDNTSRLRDRASVFYGSEPNLFGKWYAECLKNASKQDHPIVFINAWNEWAEGNYLEPDQKYGYANLNRVWKVQREDEFLS